MYNRAAPHGHDDATGQPPCDRAAMTSRPAHSLPELLLALTVVGIVAALAVERARHLLDRAAARSAAAEVASLLAIARDQAVARSRVVAVGIDSARGLVLVRAGSDTISARPVAAAYGVTLAATRDSIAWSPLGIGYGAANARIVAKRGAAAETVTVSRLGRVRGGFR